MSEPGWLAHPSTRPRPWPSAAIFVWPEWPFTDVKSPPTITREARADTMMSRTSWFVVGCQRRLTPKRPPRMTSFARFTRRRLPTWPKLPPM
jgi:hypothetical protein